MMTPCTNVTLSLHGENETSLIRGRLMAHNHEKGRRRVQQPPPVTLYSEGCQTRGTQQSRRQMRSEKKQLRAKEHRREIRTLRLLKCTNERERWGLSESQRPWFCV